MKCRHCGVPIVFVNAASVWWHRTPNNAYRACRDTHGHMTGASTAEPSEDE